MLGILGIVHYAIEMQFPRNAVAVGELSTVILPAHGSIALVLAISMIALEGCNVMDHDRHKHNMRYLAALAVVCDMLRRGLINEKDYSVLETKFAALFLPFIRYEKPSLHSPFRVTQTDEGRAFHEPNHTENPTDIDQIA